MAQKTGFLARLLSGASPKKEVCCGVQLEEIDDAAEAAPKPLVTNSADSARAGSEKDKSAAR